MIVLESIMNFKKGQRVLHFGSFGRVVSVIPYSRKVSVQFHSEQKQISASELKIVSIPRKTGQRLWTEAEHNIMRENTHLGNVELSYLLNRPYSQVASYKYRNDLKKKAA